MKFPTPQGLLILMVSLYLVSCSDTGNQDSTTGFELPPVRAELDPVNGGRFVDGEGRHVMLSGVNVNSLGEYWQFDPDVAPVYPFDASDADLVAGMGWNVVRLLLTWSYVEPEPGKYDESYLEKVEQTVRLLESRGIYSIIDLHQDAWGPSLAAREDEDCPEGTIPAVGWDGAPAWATLDKGLPRCFPDHPLFGEREFSPAVMQAFLSFWQDAEGPGGVGVQTRFHTMLSHLAARFSPLDAVLGYDPMNEPNAWNEEILAAVFPEWGLEDQQDYLSLFYERALEAIRAGEQNAVAPTRLMLIEPSPDWAQWPNASLPDFEHDGQIVHSPHIYQGGIVPEDLDEAAFERALAEAVAYGGVPVLTGEWGTSPRRVSDVEDNYFNYHQSLQDRYQISATLWKWRGGCGDPHLAFDPPKGNDPGLWGLFDVNCPGNETVGFREDFARLLRRPLLRAAPGRITSIDWDVGQLQFRSTGTDAQSGQELLFFSHDEITSEALVLAGLEGARIVQSMAPGQIWSVTASGGDWSFGVDY